MQCKAWDQEWRSRRGKGPCPSRRGATEPPLGHPSVDRFCGDNPHLFKALTYSFLLRTVKGILNWYTVMLQ